MEQVVKDVLEGRRGAARRFYAVYVGVVRRYVLSKVGSEMAAEELVQDTFLSAFDALPLYRAEASVKTWLLSIARHEVLDYYRKRYVRRLVEQTGILWEGVGESLTTPEIEWKKKELSQHFDLALNRISTRYRKVIEMRYLRGKSVKQIAESLDLPFKATESLLYRARMAFAEAYHAE